MRVGGPSYKKHALSLAVGRVPPGACPGVPGEASEFDRYSVVCRIVSGATGGELGPHHG